MKVIQKSVLVDVSVNEAWTAWTTPEGLKTFMPPNITMRLEKNGPFEILFDMSQPEGQRGSEGCVVLDWVENSSFQFTWNFPPTLPAIRDERTTVTITFTPLDGGDGSEVVLTQTGWQEGEHWNAGYTYFDSAWGMVMEGFRAAHS